MLVDPAHPLLRESSEEPLVWHVRVLMQVCRAVHFAHSRSVVHRDLKPANVMIGRFGEVYVLDWGLALRLDDEGRARAVTLAGTPAYMAPEMAVREGGEITARTDVFLLGAMLHELLAGRPPWRGGTISAVLEQVRAGSPAPPSSDAPPGLLAIAARAMARDPAARFVSAEALRVALEAYLRRRDVERLVAQAWCRLDELSELLAGAGSERLDDERGAATQGLLGECRFGFQQALQTWPESHRAREGLRALLVLMIGHELDRGRAAAAAVLMAELRDAGLTPPPELEERLRERELEEAATAARLERLQSLEHEVNIHVSERERRTVMVVTALLIALFNSIRPTRRVPDTPPPLGYSGGECSSVTDR